MHRTLLALALVTSLLGECLVAAEPGSPPATLPPLPSTSESPLGPGLDALSLDTAPPAGLQPPNPGGLLFDRTQIQPSRQTARPAPLRYAAMESAFRIEHHPTYFSQPRIERYGRVPRHCPMLVSGAHFFGTIPTLPYQVALTPPCWHVRADRPCHGTTSRRKLAAATQALVTTGLILALP